MKKILHIVEAFGGGVFTYLVDLANASAEHYDVTICYALRPQTPKDFKEQFDKRIHFIEGKSFQRSINPKKEFQSMLEIRQIVNWVKPDIIHLHSAKSGFCGRMALNCKKYKVLYTPHGYSFLKKDDNVLKRILHFMLEKVAALKKATTVCVSKGEYEESLKLTKRTMYINNGIDISKIYSGERHKTNLSSPIVCTVGRICYQKNPKLFNQIAKCMPDLRFVWIGAGEMWDEVTAPNVEITGWVDAEDVSEYIDKADIFLLPSMWEGLPIALLEAMYLGKVCIASRVIGNRDVIRHGENGFLADSCQEFVELIDQIRDGEIDVHEICSNAVRDVEENYNIEKMCQSYFKVYGE